MVTESQQHKRNISRERFADFHREHRLKDSLAIILLTISSDSTFNSPNHLGVRNKKEAGLINAKYCRARSLIVLRVVFPRESN